MSEVTQEFPRETILIVDDIPDWLETCSDILGDQGYQILTTSSSLEAVKILEQRSVDLVITDLTMPDMNGVELVKHVQARAQGCAVIVITGYPTVDTAITALKAGASDYLLKPFSPEQLTFSVRSALDKNRLRRENQFLRSQIQGMNQYGDMIGRSEVMHKLYEDLKRAAVMDARVLLVGESGTGKELSARLLHRESLRKKRHFVPINCAAIPGSLLESELFGHDAGAFTGASEARIGLIENGDGGTVFLDEIGEMPIALQAKILRVMEDGKIRHLGSTKEKAVDVRFISATNRDLGVMMAEKTFREDLFYRLNVINIRVPPLRERKEDILLLLQHFLSLHSKKQGTAPLEISTKAQDLILRYSWPGNCRELANLAQFLIFADRDGVVDVNDLPNHFSVEKGKSDAEFNWANLFDLPLADAKRVFFDQLEEKYVKHALLTNNWNISATATASGIDRRTIHRIINRLDLKRPVD